VHGKLGAAAVAGCNGGTSSAIDIRGPANTERRRMAR
jgi:hypothetical protein